MSQQINLINPALIKQKDWLTSVNISVVYGLSIAFMLGWAMYITHEITLVKESKNRLSAELAAAQAELAQMTAARAPRAPNQALLAQLAGLEGKQKVQTQILEMMHESNPSEANGLASYMRGLARQTKDGLWLTGFNIDQSNRSMTLRGRVLNADVLPDYMQNLGAEPVFSGLLFDGLQVKQVEKTAAKAIDLTANTQAVASELPYVEFELLGLKKVSLEKPGLEKISLEKISLEKLSLEKISLEKTDFKKTSPHTNTQVKS